MKKTKKLLKMMVKIKFRLSYTKSGDIEWVAPHDTPAQEQLIRRYVGGLEALVFLCLIQECAGCLIGDRHFIRFYALTFTLYSM